MGNTALHLCLVSMLLAGCGKVNDSKPTDAAVDSIDADLGGDATVVTQTALFGSAIGAAAGNIDIVSNLPNNMILASAQTDAGGNATIRVYPGGSVTAVYKHTADMGADLITWAGVKPGDTLTFGNRQPSFVGTSVNLGSQTYSWPALANATSYQVITSCAFSSAAAPATSLAASESNFCHRDPMDVLFRAFNGSTLIGYSFRSNVTFTSAGTVSIGAWITTVPTGMISITGLPAVISSVSGNFNTILDSNRVIGLTGYNGTPTGGAFSANFPWHTTGERTFGQLSFGRNGFFTMQLLDSFSVNTLTQTVAAPALPPWAQSNAIASSALGMASWYLVPDASSTYDGQLLQLTWNRNISGIFASFQWNIILPPGQMSILLPTSPSSLSDRLPHSDDFLNANTTAFDISSVTDYDMLRKQPSANVMCLRCAVEAGDFQRVVFTQF